MTYDSVIFLSFDSECRCVNSIQHEHWNSYKEQQKHDLMLFYRRNNFIKNKIYDSVFSSEKDNKYFLLFSNCDNLNVPTKNIIMEEE